MLYLIKDGCAQIDAENQGAAIPKKLVPRYDKLPCGAVAADFNGDGFAGIFTL